MTVGQSADLVGEVKDGSEVTFIIHENFPRGPAGFEDLLHEFTGTVSRGEITGTFKGGFDGSGDSSGINYQINGKFVVSVGR